MPKYYTTPFANTGDRSAIPDATQPSGSVSYSQGYGGDYQLDLATDPSAKAFPRDQNNQFCFDLTENLQQLQQFNAPVFIPSMTDGPVTFPYDKGVIVRYDAGSGFKFYQSLVDANVSLPTDTTAWRLLDAAQDILVYYTSNFGAGVVTGDIVTFSNVTGQFEKALAGNAVLENALGVADIENNYIQLSGVYNGFSGLTPGGEYYLSGSIAGAITLISPASVNTVIVGYAISSSELVVRVQKELYTTVKYGIVTFSPTGTQSVPSGFHVIQFDSVQYDPNNWWVPGSFEWKPNVPGVYQFNASVFGNITYSSTQGICVYKNGSLLYWMDETANPATASIIPGGSTPPIPMNGTTDFIQLVWQNQPGGSATTIGAQSGSNGNKSFFSIQLLGQ